MGLLSTEIFKQFSILKEIAATTNTNPVETISEFEKITGDIAAKQREINETDPLELYCPGELKVDSDNKQDKI